MQIDEFTTPFQEALNEAQSMAQNLRAAYIEPEHLLCAMLAQSESSVRSLLLRANVNVLALESEANARLGERQMHACGNRQKEWFKHKRFECGN